MKEVVAAFNQEKALVGAFYVITNLRMELFQALLTMSPEPGLAIIRRSSGCIYHTEAESRAWPAARSIKEGPSSTHFNGWEDSYFSISIFPLCQYVKGDWSADANNLIMSGTGQQQGGVNVHKWENLEKMVKNQECYWQV